MEEKKGFSKKLNAFFAGKGFYIVLLLCAVLVGTSFWLVGRGSRADVERDPVKETNITASAQETAPPQGSIPVMNTEEDERLPLGTGVLPAAEGEEMPEAQAPAVQEEMPDVPVSVNESAPQFIRPVNGVLLRGFSAEALSYDRTMADWRVHRGWDIACAAGEPVLAVSGGTVTAVYEDDLLGTVSRIGDRPRERCRERVRQSRRLPRRRRRADGRLRRHGRRRRHNGARRIRRGSASPLRHAARRQHR